MIKKIIRVIRRFLFMFLMIYSYNIFISPMNLLIPFNIITIMYVGFFGIPAFLSIIFLTFVMYWGELNVWKI